MGGRGSGPNWPRKTQADECIQLAASYLQRNGYIQPEQVRMLRIRWTVLDAWDQPTCHPDQGEWEVVVRVEGVESGAIFPTPKGDPWYLDAIPLVSTPLPWGGRRWWLRCPLAYDGLPCDRRVDKLYLPPRGVRAFGCRRCHDLAYWTSQTAHRAERRDKADKKWMEKWMRRNFRR